MHVHVQVHVHVMWEINYMCVWATGQSLSMEFLWWIVLPLNRVWNSVQWYSVPGVLGLAKHDDLYSIKQLYRFYCLPLSMWVIFLHTLKRSVKYYVVIWLYKLVIIHLTVHHGNGFVPPP